MNQTRPHPLTSSNKPAQLLAAVAWIENRGSVRTVPIASRPERGPHGACRRVRLDLATAFGPALFGSAAGTGNCTATRGTRGTRGTQGAQGTL